MFSVIDDQNTGGHLNPNGNFKPFQQVLDKFIAYPITTPVVGMSIGPFRLIQSKANNSSTTIEEFIVNGIPPCGYGAYCENLNDQNHCHSKSHPPLCPFGSECTENADDVHCQMFIHRKKCPNGGQCVQSDVRHLADFDHPKYCLDEGHCTNMNTDHLNLYRHVPICEHGMDCNLRYTQKSQHLTKFRHCPRPCAFGGHCVRFHDQKHITNEGHPFNPPCPFSPFHCKMFTKLQSADDQSDMNEIKKHCFHYSHVCPWGRLCNDQSDEHLLTTIHIPRHMCPNGNNSCKQMMEEDHLDSFSHLNIRDIRLLCRYPGSECRDRTKIEHIIKYRHNYTLDYLGVAQYFSLNKQVNFVQNQTEMTRMIHEYVDKIDKKAWKKVNVPKELLDWIDALQPIHRCIGPIFESILVHGHVMSRSHMERLEDPIFVAHTVDQHQRVRRILAKHGPAFQKNAQKFIEALVRMEFNKGNIRHDNEESLQYRIHTMKQTLKPYISESDIEEISLVARQITEASFKLHSNMSGIGFGGDLMFGTNQQVFSILGPHSGQYYGDIVIIFKRDVMLHPDTNFTMQAATMYTEKTYKCRPWLTDSGSQQGHIKQFNSTKLHCSIPGYNYVAALELMAITGAQKQTLNSDLDSILHRWKEVDSHQVIEAHLPQLIPLSYIEHIYIPKNIFDSLSPEAKKNARELFPNNLTITKHMVDVTVDPMAFSKPDVSRKEYETYIREQILKSIKRRQEQHAILSSSKLLTLYGMTVTIPATNFENYITNPLTITQSCDQYLNQSHKTSTSEDSVYIYFKALRGDFMIILTNEMIETGKVQPNLVHLTCYIAPFVNVNNDSNYNEQYTYINNSPPASHKIVLEEQNFKPGSRSNTFHKGCNPDDYILYCLKLNLEKGQVSLMNAGVNSLYNYTILKYTFEPNEFDLTSLDYIHLSAGHQSVSIRNLVISHELIPEAHPKIDKEFIDHTHNTNSQHSIVDKSNENNDNSDNTLLNRALYQPIKRAIEKLWPGNEEPSEEKNDEPSNNHEKIEYLPPCKDSIYCLDQYSTEKSLSHNQRYSHPCRFSELCQNIHNMSHCIQFTHNKLDIPKCQLDTNCTKLNDPVHRCSFRHTGLPDYLYPCRYQQECRNSSFEHRTKYFHGEKIKQPSVVQNTRKGKQIFPKIINIISYF